MSAPSRFQKATRKKAKLRMALDGPSGSGKTATALRFAMTLARAAAAAEKREPRIAVIDSEHGSASKYAGEDFGEGPISFDVIELHSFAPTEYTSGIEEAGRLGYDVIVADSLSHAWEGKEGALEIVDGRGGNRFTAWKDVTPMHRRMIDAILTSPAHVICTMRSKTDYVLEKDEHGKQVPVRVGTAPVQRSGMEYEFDLYGSLDYAHVMRVTKTRCRLVDGWVGLKPGAAFLQPVIDWLESGVSSAAAASSTGIQDDQMQQVLNLTHALGWNADRIAKELPSKYGVTGLQDLRRQDADNFIAWLRAQLAGEERKRAARAAAPLHQPPAAAPAAAQPPAPAAAPTSPARGTVTDAQLATLKQYRLELFASQPPEAVAAAWKGILTKRGVTSALQLSTEAAQELIAAIAHKLNLRAIDQGINGPQANGTTPNGSPMTQPPAQSVAPKGGSPAPVAGPRQQYEQASANPHRH